jgi:hypothetical protein
MASSGVSPMRISTVLVLLSRQRVIGTPLPGVALATARWRSCGPSSFLPSNSVMMSPAWMPAFSAGPSEMTSEMRTPFASLRPKPFASSGVRGWIDTPSQPRVTLPLATSSV